MIYARNLYFIHHDRQGAGAGGRPVPGRRMTLSSKWWTPLGLWLVVMAAGLALRPPLPVDETRYLAVAWEMWRDGNFLVPHLNGEAYSHKPPLLFWLINLGWGYSG